MNALDTPMRTPIKIVCLLIVAFSFSFALSVHAAIRVTISPVSEQIVLASVDDEFRQKYRLVKFGELAMATSAPANCETLGSELINEARSASRTYEAVLARYNLVSVWLGNMCHGKTDRLPDTKEAKRWLFDLATQPDPFNLFGESAFYEAPALLMQAYLFGAPQVESDLPAAIAYLSEKRPTYLVRPEFYWSYMYLYGLGVPKDAQEARAWIKRLPPLNPDRRALVAQWQEVGDGEAKNEKQAFDDYLALAKNMHGPARFRLGVMYLEGRGTDRNPCEAKYWLQLVANDSRWPIPQAQPYLERIESDRSCPQSMPERAILSRGFNSKNPATSTKPSADRSSTGLVGTDAPLVGARSPEDVDAVFERNRGAVFAVYARALRENEGLRGKVEFRLSISAQGEVSECEVVSSEIDNSELLTKLIARQRLLRFPPIERGTQVILRTWDFRPEF